MTLVQRYASFSRADETASYAARWIVQTTMRWGAMLLPRMALIVLFFSSLSFISVLNGVSLVILLLLTPFLRLQRLTRPLQLLWAMALVLVQLICQLKTIAAPIAANFPDASYAGIRQLPTAGGSLSERGKRVTNRNNQLL